MSSSSRRVVFALTMAASIVALSAVGRDARAQKAKKPLTRPPAVPAGGGAIMAPGMGGGMPGGRPGVPPKKAGYDLGSLTLPKDDDLKERIEFAVDQIKLKDYKRACDTLQALITRHEDIFVPITRQGQDGTETTAYVSVKKEAARLIATMPKAGRDMYQATFGEKASRMVKHARETNDRTEMAQAMGLYLYTDEGADAANWLATWHLDRAEFQAAANFFQQLINRGGLAELKPRTLLKAAYAFHHAGDKAARDLVFKELERRGAEIKLGAEPRTVAALQETINHMVARVSLQSASDSPIYRGRPNRTAMLPGGTPFLEPAWKQKLIHSEATSQQVKRAETALETRNLPLLTAFSPVTATMAHGDKKVPLLIYRTYGGIQAVEMRTGKLEWAQPSDWSLDRILGATGHERSTYSNKLTAYTTWLGMFLQSNARPQILFENSTLSTLAADSKMVYAVEDIALPPPQQYVMMDPRMGGMGGMPGAGMNWGPDVGNAIQHNKLQAFDLNKGGKVAWEIGTRDGKGPLDDAFFLGPPLPLNGRLYVLTEKQQELRLATIDPATGKLIGIQPLANTKDLKLWQEPLRRIQACQLAYAEGVLVVPTNAGAVFGVDLLSNSLLWAYPYRDKDNNPQAAANNMRMLGGGGRVIRGGMVMGGAMAMVQPASMETHWLVTAPAVADGKTVFTAPDGKEIHCVNLRDGSRAWSQSRRPDDLYLAGVFAGKAIIVGKSRTRALSLARGEVVWELETGLPSGQGAAGAPNASGDIIYYLPVREAVNTREPEVCAINVTRGIVHAHTRSRKKEVPGNLLFYEGNVLSQTHTEVVAYPQLEVQLAKMDAELTTRPNDPVALTERGDYLLDKGDLKGAIADFRKALRNDPPEPTRAKARTKLYEAFTEHFQRDFAKAEEHLKEYEEMCRIDLENKTGAERTALEAEMRRRRANFLCLVGKGREGQNRLVEAFEKYLELGIEARKDELIQVIDEPSVKAAPDIWSQGRIAAMVRNATDAKQKKALEDLITQKWAKLKESSAPGLDELRNFVALFGSLFDVGKEARLTLAERLMEDTDVGSLLEAEQQLSLLRGEGEKPAIAARALEALARLNARKGLLEDAAWYYRLLGERYPKVSVDGKTGQEYLDDLATDKRFLPYLDQAGRFVIKGKAILQSKEESGGASPNAMSYQFGHTGEGLPFFSRHKLELDMGWNHQLRLTDIATNEERWKLPLTRTQFEHIARNNNQPHRARFSYQSVGHLVVLQLGHMVFGIDPLNKGRVLWEKNLSSLPGSATAAPMPNGSPAVDSRDGSVELLYPDGWMQRLGQAGPLQGGVICLQTRDALKAIDPVTGRELWTRTDVNSRTHVFGDDAYIYVVGIAEDKSASGTRVFRAHDGVSVKVPDFSAAFQKRIRVQGRTILASETDAKNALTLRLYDVFQGKDVWKQTFPPGTTLLQSEDPRLAGVVEPGGTVRVYDVQERKEVVTSQIASPQHIQRAQGIYLVSDPDYLFLAVNGPADPNLAWAGGPQPNVQPGSGLRSVPVNGMVYCIERGTGKVRWYNPVENEQMIVSQFAELPMVLFTARYNYLMPNRAQGSKHTARAIAKHNGKLWYDQPQVSQHVLFHSLTMDHRTGTVELSGGGVKVTMTATPR
jgi:outer membrane protein assembly factor BamB/tetratricopeptide (TPR) repeat protein